MSLAPILQQRTSVRAEPVHENSSLDTDPRLIVHLANGNRRAEATQAPQWKQEMVPGTARAALLKRQGEEKTQVDALPPRGQRKEMSSIGTETLTLQTQDMKTRNSGDQNGRLTATRAVLTRNQGKALATTGVMTTIVREKAKTTATVPAKEKAAEATVAPSPCPTTPGLKAANFKSEPRWDFEEKYSFDVGGLQTVSVCCHLFSPFLPL